MPILYVDNFRGFKTTFLPLQEINFFVGENSTGKTSILKLLGILSSQEFWRYNIFGESDATSLGTFNEIKTMGSDKDFFEVAFVDQEEEGGNLCAFKFKFIEYNGFPLFKEIRYINSRINLQAIIDGNILKYRFERDPKMIEDISNLDFFRLWISHTGEINKVPFQRTSLNNLSILQVLWKLESLLFDGINESESNVINLPQFLNNTAWFAPSVAKPVRDYEQQRLVFTPTGIHTPTLLKEIISNKDVVLILKKFGKDSGLYDELSVEKLLSNSHDSFNNSHDSFKLIVTVNDKKLNIVNVGYGVSQILPLIVETIARPDNSWIISQQPETHLHPRAQAALGDFIYKSNIIDKQKFIIETHTDFTIDRLRVRLNRDYKSNQNHITKDSCQVVFFNRKDDSNNLTTIQINEDGSYDNKQPVEFRDFFIKEQLNLIRI